MDSLCEAGVKSIKDDDDVLYHLHPNCFVTTREEVFEPTVEWLKQEGVVIEDFVKQAIVGRRLREYVKELLETKGELAMPDFLGLDTAPGITAKGWDAAQGMKGKQ